MAGSTAHAASVIFNDTFDSGTGAYYRAYTTANTALTNTANRLSFAVSTFGGNQVIGRSFSTQTLAVGDSITLTLDFRQTSATGIFRLGLYDLSAGAFGAAGWANTDNGTYAGYTTFIRNNGTNIARRESASFTTATNTGYPTAAAPSGAVTDITTSGGSTDFTFANNTDYQFTFNITRSSATQTDTLLTVMEGATTRYSVGGS